MQTQIDALLSAVARLPNDEQVAQLAAAAAPLTRAVGTEPNAGAWITAPVGERRERHGRGSVASTRVQRRAGRRRAAGRDGTDGGGPECAVPVYHDGVLMGGLRRPSRIAGVNEGTERSAIVTCDRHLVT